MIADFFKIIKWKLLIHIVLIQFLFKFCFLYGYGFQTTLSFVKIALLSFATICVVSSGYLIHYSLKSNKFSKLKFPKGYAKIVSYSLCFLGFIINVYLSFYINKPWYSFIYIISIICVLIYSKKVKKKSFITNLLSAFLRVFCILLVWWFDYPINLSISQLDFYFYLEIITVFYLVLSFFGNIIRELLIDIRNINIDQINKQNTLPVLLGRKRTKNFILYLSIFITTIITISAITLITNKFLLNTIILLGTFPQLFFIYSIINTTKDKEYNALLHKSNLLYIIAIISVPLISSYIKYVS